MTDVGLGASTRLHKNNEVCVVPTLPGAGCSLLQHDPFIGEYPGGGIGRGNKGLPMVSPQPQRENGICLAGRAPLFGSHS